MPGRRDHRHRGSGHDPSEGGVTAPRRAVSPAPDGSRL